MSGRDREPEILASNRLSRLELLMLSGFGISVKQDGPRVSMDSFLELEWLLQYSSGLFQERSHPGFFLRVSGRFCLSALLSRVARH